MSIIVVIATLLLLDRVILVGVGHPADRGGGIHSGAGRTLAGTGGTRGAERRIRNAVPVSCNPLKPSV